MTTEVKLSTPVSVLKRDRIDLFPATPEAANASPTLTGRQMQTIAVWRRLQFNMQLQTQSNWCWAATTTSVNRYYNYASTLTQCQCANDLFGQTTCCSNGSSDACNRPAVTSDALQARGNLQRVANAPASFTEIQQEIDNGRPIALRIAWQGGGGHAVVVEGYLSDATTPMVAVEDPIYGSLDINYETFKTNYQGSGSWHLTYFTKSGRIHIQGGVTAGRRAMNVVARDPNKLDVFTTGTDGVVYTAAWDQNVTDGKWRGWWNVLNGRSIPGATIASVARDPNKLDIFVAGTDGGIYTAAWDQNVDNAKWRGWWNILGGKSTPGGGVAAVARDRNKLDVFTVGTDGFIYTAAWDQNVANAQWRGWWRIGNLKAVPGSPISVVSRDPNKLDVFVVGEDGCTYTAAWDQNVANAQWRGWWHIAGGRSVPGATLTAVSRDPNKLDVFVTGPNGDVYTAAWDQNVANAQWRGWWSILGGRTAAGGPIAAVARDRNKLDVFVVGTDNRMYTAAWDQFVANAQWRGWWVIGDGTYTQNAPIAAVARTPDSLDLVMADSQGNTYTAAWSQTIASARWRG